MITDKLRDCLIEIDTFVKPEEILYSIDGLVLRTFCSGHYLLDARTNRLYAINKNPREALEDYILYTDLFDKIFCNIVCPICKQPEVTALSIIFSIADRNIKEQKWFYDNIDKFKTFICCDCYRKFTVDYFD